MSFTFIGKILIVKEILKFPKFINLLNDTPMVKFTIYDTFSIT